MECARRAVFAATIRPDSAAMRNLREYPSPDQWNDSGNYSMNIPFNGIQYQVCLSQWNSKLTLRILAG
jgi:hypothetical protein